MLNIILIRLKRFQMGKRSCQIFELDDGALILTRCSSRILQRLTHFVNKICSFVNTGPQHFPRITY